MSPLDGMCWPEVLSALLAGAPDLPGDAALYLQPHAWLSPRHRVLAVCAMRAGRDGCAAAVADRAIGEWLHDTSRFANRALTPHASRRAFTRFTGWVRIDPMLPGLPLLGLALQHAERAQERLILTRADLGPLTLGRTIPRAEVSIDGRPSIVTLVELAQADAETWAHELGHVVDPADPRRDPVAGEAFADTLGPLLLAERPDSLAELDALITRAETTIGHSPPAYRTPGTPPATPGTGAGAIDDGDELPAPGLDSLLAFAGLDLNGWRTGATAGT